MNSSLQRITILRVALDVPLSISTRGASMTAGDALFDYRWTGAAQLGQRVIVPWGRQNLVGIIAGLAPSSDVDPARLRDASAVLDDVAPLPQAWFELMRFAARYYQRSLGEVCIPALPVALRKPSGYTISTEGATSRGMTALQKKLMRLLATQNVLRNAPSSRAAVPDLTPEQRQATETISAQLRSVASNEEDQNFSPTLLYGITGSGKTEVYLQLISAALAHHRQVLVLVPEINLTPQLERLFRARCPGSLIATLHSGMADGERALNWLVAHLGHADVLLGTRMAVMTPLPRLGLIVVDEEHDPSYKQQEGLRYSARDLAVMRGQQQRVPVVLGSATPSLESWSQVERHRYQKLTLTTRAVEQASLPEIRLIDLRRTPLEHGFSDDLRLAIAERLLRNEQVLVFLNRRGYAPVLCCGACGWISDCRRCSAHMVFHKSDRNLHCHHCGAQVNVPRACPECGNLDLAPLGRGTQRVQEALEKWFPNARIARIDRDSTRRKGSAEKMLAAVHRGEVDLLVGTQMVAKGHDFQNLTLVCVVDADSALFSHDFRAPERLFSNLMQVAGRAGRAGKPGMVLIQTRFATHPLFAALARHEYPSFAATQLVERERAGLPPYSYQAMLRAEARNLTQAIEFLSQARALAENVACAPDVTLFDPVPMSLVRIANLDRAQLLVESRSRPALQAFLPAWLVAIHAIKTTAHWHLEVDPLEI